MNLAAVYRMCMRSLKAVSLVIILSGECFDFWYIGRTLFMVVLYKRANNYLSIII